MTQSSDHLPNRPWARRALLQTGLGAAALALVPGLAEAADPFFIEVVQTPPGAEPRQGDLLDTAVAAGQFTSFVRIVRAAGYEDTLRGPGPFTVFAPSNEAFAAMRRAEFERLLLPSSHAELLALVSYHVVPGRLTSASLHGRVSRLHTANGYSVNVDGRDGLRINDQLVATPDIEARNGVLHGLNAVLSPPVAVAQAVAQG